MASRWVIVEAERILYVQRGRDTILCTMHEFPLGATLVLRVRDDDSKCGALENKTDQ